VHRDISPQNILVGSDGVARVVDFGIAKAERRMHETEAGRIKGKFAYMAPEQVKSRDLDRRTDVFAAGIVLWEALSGRRLFEDDTNPLVTLRQVAEAPLVPPSRFAPELSAEVDQVVMRALSRPKEERFQTAREMAIALERAIPPALQREVSEWVQELAHDALRRRRDALTRLQKEESGSDASDGAAELGRALESDEATTSYTNSVVAVPPAAAAQTAATTLLVAPAPSGAPASATAPEVAAAKRPQPFVVGAVLGALVFCVLWVAGLSLRKRATGSEPELPTADITSTPSLPTLDALPRPDAATPAAQRDAALHEEAGPIATGSTSATPPTTRTSTPTSTARVPHVAKPNCQPPYWVDADGIKHYKRECDLGK
jgi:serine/threonine-protein kinase